MPWGLLGSGKPGHICDRFCHSGSAVEMATMLGKRKRRASLSSESPVQNPESDGNDTQEALLFQQYFEKQFMPLEQPPSLMKEISEDSKIGPDSDQGESDWEGLSEGPETQVEVIQDLSLLQTEKDALSKEWKTFMSTKPPSKPTTPAQDKKPKSSKSADLDDESNEAVNLKNDLALQRLLKESHLLDPQSSLDVHGPKRHRALDLHLQDLGSKTSLYRQQKMPLAHRKGITAKVVERDEMRRREARENGIVLEKAKKVMKVSGGKRLRGVGGPSVGRFQGGMLKLSRKDVESIEGPSKKSKVKRR